MGRVTGPETETTPRTPPTPTPGRGYAEEGGQQSWEPRVRAAAEQMFPEGVCVLGAQVHQWAEQVGKGCL